MLLLKWLVMTVSILIAAHMVPGITVDGFFTALWVALVLGIVNVLLKPFLIIITLPINILTFGLFTLVINALLVLLASAVVGKFAVSGFWAAMLFSVAVSIMSYLLNRVIGTR